MRSHEGLIAYLPSWYHRIMHESDVRVLSIIRLIYPSLFFNSLPPTFASHPASSTSSLEPEADYNPLVFRVSTTHILFCGVNEIIINI